MGCYLGMIHDHDARELSPAHLSVLDAAPPELVTVAAATGFRKVGNKNPRDRRRK